MRSSQVSLPLLPGVSIIVKGYARTRPKNLCLVLMIFTHNVLYIQFLYFEKFFIWLCFCPFLHHNSMSWALISSTSPTFFRIVLHIVENAHPSLYHPIPLPHTHTHTLINLTYFPWLPTGHVLFLFLAVVLGFYSLFLAILHTYSPLFSNSFLFVCFYSFILHGY